MDKPEAGQQEPQEPTVEPQAEPEPEPDATAAAEPSDGGEGLKDRHGQQAISKGKYERDMKDANDRIAELTKQLDEASKSDERANGLKEELEKVQSGFADKELSYRLALAGCINEKAAKAVLDDYDGDIEKCKAACPYLFGNEKQKGSTGPKTGSAGNAALDAELEKAFRAR